MQKEVKQKVKKEKTMRNLDMCGQNIHTYLYIKRGRCAYHYLDAWWCSIIDLAPNMGLHYLPFKGRKLQNRKDLTPVRIMNSVSLNNKDIVNSVSIFNASVVINNNYMGIILG